MPLYPKHPCAHVGCGSLVSRGVSRCPAHANDSAPSDIRREKSQALYNTRRWRTIRVNHLRANPLCVSCLREGRTVPGRVADHVVPHNGDVSLFYDESNLQTLCDFTTKYNCHGKKTAKEAGARSAG
jgi:5-methylcytosine-specific restriction protein A